MFSVFGKQLWKLHLWLKSKSVSLLILTQIGLWNLFYMNLHHELLVKDKNVMCCVLAMWKGQDWSHKTNEMNIVCLMLEIASVVQLATRNMSFSFCCWVGEGMGSRIKGAGNRSECLSSNWIQNNIFLQSIRIYMNHGNICVLPFIFT